MATSLTSDVCDSVADATDVFATQKGLLILKPKSSSCSTISFTIPSGCYALVSRHGADLDYMDEDGNRYAIWPAGLHFPYLPWIRVSYLITKQSIVFDLPIKTYRTKDDVTVNIDVSLTFRIMGDPDLGEDSYLIRNFVHERKPSGLEKQLSDALEEAVRALVRLMDHTEIYGIRSSIKVGLDNKVNREKDIDDFSYFLSGSSSGSDSLAALPGEGSRGARQSIIKGGHNATDIMRKRLNRQFILQGIEILSVVIKNVSLPEEIQSQMERKTLSISEEAEQQILLKESLQSTRMEEEIRTKIQTLNEERELETQTGLETINTEKVRLNDAVSQARKSEATMREETNVRMCNFTAQNEYVIQRVRDKTTAGAATIDLKTKKLANELITTTKLQNEQDVASASLLSAKNQVAADKKLTEAEGVTADWTKKSKNFMTDLKKIDVFDSLASNENMILGSLSDDDGNIITFDRLPRIIRR